MSRAFTCPFLEKDGKTKIASSRSAFRRHLTVHHGMDYVRQASGKDDFVTLLPAQLTARMTVIRRSQRRRPQSSAGVENATVLPTMLSDSSRLFSIRGTLSRRECYRAPSPPEVEYEPSISESSLAPPPKDYKSTSDSVSDLSSGQDSSIDWTDYDYTQMPLEFWGSGDQPCLSNLEADSFAEVAMDTVLSHVGPLVTPHCNATSNSEVLQPSGLGAWLESRGLSTQPSAQPARLASPLARVCDVEVQTTDPRIIAPDQYITYRQTFCTFIAASHMAMLLRASTSLDAVALADLTSRRLGLSASDQPSWDALYRMAITAIIVERELQHRLAEILATTATTDPTGALAVASILIEMSTRNRRPWEVADLPQPGDEPHLRAIEEAAIVIDD